MSPTDFKVILSGSGKSSVASRNREQNCSKREVLSTKFYETKSNFDAVSEAFESDRLWTNVGINRSEDLEDEKYFLLLGAEKEIRIRITIWEKPNKDGTLVAITGFIRSSTTLSRLEDFDSWVIGKYSTIANFLKTYNKIDLTEIQDQSDCSLPLVVSDHITKRYKGLFYVAREYGSASIRRIAVVLVSLAVLYLLYANYKVSVNDNAIILVTIIVWQFAPAAIEKRRRGRHH